MNASTYPLLILILDVQHIFIKVTLNVNVILFHSKPDIPTQVLSSNFNPTHTTTTLNPSYYDNNIIQSMLMDGTSTLQGLVEELSKLK